MTPLEIFLARWQAAIPATAITYIEAVNQQADMNDAPDPWGAAVLQPEARSDVTLGSQPWVEESGTFLIGLFTRSGLGPAALDQAVDYVRATFHGYRSSGLLITQVDGPHDVDPAAMGEWWQVALTARYTFQTRRDARGSGFGNWSGFPETPPAPLPGPG
jgi:hypothetical protein